MTGPALDVPPAWERLDLEALNGVLPVLGKTDVGKTTFARYLFQQLASARPQGLVAFLDGDPGQTTLGVPGTMTLALNRPGEAQFPPQGHTWRIFIGSNSPRGHMLSILSGAGRLCQAAREAGASAIVYDTSGFIAPGQGGLALKEAKINLLRPATVFAIQQGTELEVLLTPLRRSGRTRVITFDPSAAVRSRSQARRQAYRREQYARYFDPARPLSVDWTRLGVFPFPRFVLHQLAALEDSAGFTVALGIITEIERDAHRVVLHTPLRSLEGVTALRLGAMTVTPVGYQERYIDP